MKIFTYLKSFIVFNLLLAAAPLYVQFSDKKDIWLVPYFWGIFAFFAILNVAVYLVSVWGTLTSNKASVQSFMAGTGLKFLFSMIFVFFYLRANNVNSTFFLIDFFYLYLFQLVFEIYSLLRNLRNQNL